PVNIVGRDVEAWADLADLAPHGRVQAHEVDLEAGSYQRHSVRSHLLAGSDSRSRSTSSPCWCIRWKASSHPLRGLTRERITRWSSRTSSSTASVKWQCSSTVLGMRIPRELPIRTTLAFMAYPPSRFQSDYEVITEDFHGSQVAGSVVSKS